MLTDQQYYDILFALYRAVAALAGEANDKERARQDATVRALRAEVALREIAAERDDYKAMVRRAA